MGIEDHPDINPERKAKILALTDAELVLEIERGPYSFMPKSIPFMKAVLEERRGKAELARQQAAEKHNNEMIDIARAANEKSDAANRYALWAIAIAIVAAVIAVVKNG